MKNTDGKYDHPKKYITFWSVYTNDANSLLICNAILSSIIIPIYVAVYGRHIQMIQLIIFLEIVEPL